MGYQVKSPLVQAKKGDGSYVHVYEGGLLPEDIDKEQLKQLLESQMVVREGAAAAPSPSDDDGDDDRPAGNASKDEWKAYAIANGVSEEEAESLSRDDLRDRFSQ